eukprot:CAMPEP_0118674634 /NCGR_PEP_ID=MMETSP0800-20121206/997_1 /TAXON_ID=210618 ORGANISM="Striatella unipunctata, Strain CCMP2910" /NCGR_SAMPLE_ID=MMETSP0800 /ASSEMBLY_ACC=CAM_ASM_000638 /LENGTH=211 /DNA_ID=CAMNT_0006569851 /DNA_START=52 /DNA_END=687 /DNA_ORIENTATION=-
MDLFVSWFNNDQHDLSCMQKGDPYEPTPISEIISRAQQCHKQIQFEPHTQTPQNTNQTFVFNNSNHNTPTTISSLEYVNFERFVRGKEEERTYLPRDFDPLEYDVICGKGKKAYRHKGNKRLRDTIDYHLEEYTNAKRRIDKRAIITNIFCEIRGKKGGFVRYACTDGRWYDIGDSKAREKIGQMFRDTLELRKAQKKLKLYTNQHSSSVN